MSKHILTTDSFPVVTDTRQLGPHWRTVQWFEQRKQCERCKHIIVETPAIKCDVTPWVGIGRGYCIDAREPGQRCGTNAILFRPKGSK